MLPPFVFTGMGGSCRGIRAGFIRVIFTVREVQPGGWTRQLGAAAQADSVRDARDRARQG